MMNLLFEGRIGCFQPVTYLDRTDITQIRPLLYCKEEDIRRMAARLRLPVVKNTCPMDGHSRRQEVKELISRLEGRYPDLKKKLFGAVQRYPLYGWDLTRRSGDMTKNPLRWAAGRGRLCWCSACSARSRGSLRTCTSTCSCTTPSPATRP